MQSSNLLRYWAIWIFAGAVMLLMMLTSAMLQPREVPSARLDHNDLPRQTLMSLLQDAEILDKTWLSRATQGATLFSNAVPPVDKDLQGAWKELLDDAQSLMGPASQVLNPENIVRSQGLLQPYLKNTHAETSKLARELDGHLRALMAYAPAHTGASQLNMTWQNLAAITDHTDQIQMIISGMRRLSQTNGVASDAKFSISLFTQLSVTFPTVVGREFENIAKRLVQRRWAMLYQLEKVGTPVVTVQVQQPPSSHWWLLSMALIGLIGVFFLISQQRQIGHWQHQLQLESKNVLALQGRLLQSESNQFQRQESAPVSTGALLPQNFARDVSDLRGRIKAIQLRFDTGQALDAAVQDLALMDDRLANWEQVLPKTDSRGAQHA